MPRPARAARVAPTAAERAQRHDPCPARGAWRTFGLGAASLALVAMAFLLVTPWTTGIAAGVVGLGFGTVMLAARGIG